MILLQSLKTKFSLTDYGIYCILCDEEYAGHIEPKICYSASTESSQYSGGSHICEMLYMVSTKGFQ